MRIKAHIIAALVSITVVAPLAWAAFDTAPVLHFHSDPKITPDPVSPGEVATIFWDVTALRPCGGTVRRYVVHMRTKIETKYADQPIIFPTTSSAEIGKRMRYQREFVVPTERGLYEHRAEVERVCNRLQAWLPFFRFKETNSVMTFEVR